jgi:hypothetical protein
MLGMPNCPLNDLPSRNGYRYADELEERAAKFKQGLKVSLQRTCRGAPYPVG